MSAANRQGSWTQVILNHLGLSAAGKRSRKASCKARQNRRTLQFEGLEKREMFSVSSVTFNDVNDTLYIKTDHAATSVQVSTVGANVRVSEMNGNAVNRYWSIASSKVKAVEFNGGDGNDRFVNNVASLRAGAYGNGGNDYLQGNQGADYLVGGIGNDTLYGGGGSDGLWGDTTSSKDTAKDGNDTIFGGAGNDVLRGGGGHDNLYGEDGADKLYGQSGNDGLFGGVGANDSMDGGSGSDRFYQPLDATRVVTKYYWANTFNKWLGIRTSRLAVETYNEDPITGFDSSQDVVLKYGDLKNPAVGAEKFKDGKWTNTDIQKVDEAIGNMHRHTGNAKFLKTADGKQISLWRAGEQTTLSKGEGYVGGWNQSGTGRITITQETFKHSNVLSTVYHEFGHNWDDPKENARATQFRSLSQWDQKADAGDVQSLDKKWHYSAAASFAREYGKTDPFEDYATSWAAFFNHKYHNAKVTNVAVLAKLNNVASLVGGKA